MPASDKRFLDHLYLVLSQRLVSSCLEWHPSDPHKFIWHVGGDEELKTYLSVTRGRFGTNRVEAFQQRLMKLQFVVFEEALTCHPGKRCTVFGSRDGSFYRTQHDVEGRRREQEAFERQLLDELIENNAFDVTDLAIEAFSVMSTHEEMVDEESQLVFDAQQLILNSDEYNQPSDLSNSWYFVADEDVSGAFNDLNPTLPPSQ
ncbi:hypothetical protein Poli38472_008305 [Pythium oligandrum]|uniref:HSF-type DNA-binding domain-containing protein n=1 Tax=Pythium oligandrum TaxID=41045 RepID=A0A8K1CNT3_PYTOL|nr:hypothetical protein Poli38472_008305 [Pythium oligandrum]|eukprot:TMW65663.1 hypothetical protein Poli38472_008305 [Pythium oligandrum]